MFILWLILGSLSVLYGGFILAARSGTRFFLVWFALGAACFLLAVLAKKHVWKKLPRGLKVTCGVLIGLGLTLFFVVEGIIVSHFKERGEQDLDYIIVLGAQVRESGPSLVLRYRLDAACEYLMENKDTVCIVTGAKGYNEPVSEAEGMKRYLVEKGIDEARILMEEKATSTMENLLFSQEFLDKETDRVGVVTNDFHLFRAMSLARHQGYRHVCGIAAGSRPAYQLNNMLREFLGVMKDLVMGNLL